MSDLIWLSEAQMRRIEPYFSLSHGVPRLLAQSMSPEPSTTLADLLTPLLAANPFSTMRASLRR
jgi:hypothetical protein